MRKINWIVMLTALLVFTVLTPHATAMYNPTLGRFMQQDPRGYADSMNAFLPYADNPVNRQDPQGENVIVVAFAGLGGGIEGKKSIITGSWAQAAKEGNAQVDYRQYGWQDASWAYTKTINDLKTPIKGTDCTYNSLVVLGHSFGGNAVVEYANMIAKDRIGIDGVVTADPRQPNPFSIFPIFAEVPFDAPPNVFIWENFYQRQQPFWGGARVNGPWVVNSQLTENNDHLSPHDAITQDPLVKQAITAQVRSAGTGRRWSVVTAWMTR